MMEDLNARAKKAHTWWNKETLQNQRESIWVLNGWIDLFKLGYQYQEIRRVLIYLRQEIAAKRRNPGCLSLQNFLRPENFEKDLALANMTHSGALDPDRPVSAIDSPTRPSASSNEGCTKPTVMDPVAAAQKLKEWRHKTGI